MKFVALVSGGKDSIYSIQLAIAAGHELCACIHLAKPRQQPSIAESLAKEGSTTNDTESSSAETPPAVVEESYMYQSAASECVKVQVEECIGVPLVHYVRTGRSVNTTLVYDGPTADTNDRPQSTDEVEDLYVAVQRAIQQFPDVTAVSSGAILSTYQRVRIENVCARLGLQSLSYLWRRDVQANLLHTMVGPCHKRKSNDNNDDNDDNDSSSATAPTNTGGAGIVAVLVQTAAPPGLVPRKHLNRTLAELEPLFHRLHARYQFHVCGEGGEYESLVLDCPGLFRKRLVLDDVQVVLDDHDDGVGYLRILACHAEAKENDTTMRIQSETLQPTSIEQTTECTPQQLTCESKNGPQHAQSSMVHCLPHIRRVQGGLWHVSEMLSPVAATDFSCEADAVVTETLQILDLLQTLLLHMHCTAQDVLMVHLYLSEISHFALINQHYRQFFGVILPPSRSTVAVGRDVLPGGRRVLLDCLVQCGSGASMRGSETKNPYATHGARDGPLRDVLHVQSLSDWAPVCVGPYSQVNTVRSCLHFCAGQIGLVPATMTLRSTWMEQLQQCWTNVARVLDALDATTLDHTLSALLLVEDCVFFEANALSKMSRICMSQMECNGGVVAGQVDGITQPKTGDLDGYEDEETRREMEGELGQFETGKIPCCPILVVSIAQMPVGALAEVEILAASRKAVESLQITESIRKSAFANCDFGIDASPFGWDTGHDFEMENIAAGKVEINTFFRKLGLNAAACAIVTASCDSDRVQPGMVIRRMFRTLLDESTFDHSSILHIRLYYTAAQYVTTAEGKSQAHVKKWNDGIAIRSALLLAIGTIFTVPPTCTVVPVQGMCVLTRDSSVRIGSIIFAVQVVVTDPIQMEQAMWVQQQR